MNTSVRVVKESPLTIRVRRTHLFLRTLSGYVSARSTERSKLRPITRSVSASRNKVGTVGKDKHTTRVVGKLVITFTELEDGLLWGADVQPHMLTGVVRDNYKLALITADMMAHLKKSLGFIDTILHTKADMDRMHNEMMTEKEHAVADVDKHQTKLPFGELKG